MRVFTPHRGSASEPVFHRIAGVIEYHGLYCEIDTRLTDPAHLERVLYIAHKLGADVVRTYINKNEYSQRSMSQTVQGIRSVIPLLAYSGLA